MVRIRLKRMGRKNRPFYRIAVFDARTKRDGATLDLLGTYDPIEKDESKILRVDAEKAKGWLARGAEPSETVRSLFRKASVL